MPNLESILRSGTLLRAATKTSPYPQTFPITIKEKDPKAVSDVKKRPIWHYKQDAGDLSKVTDVTCWMQHKDSVTGATMEMRMPVCSYIQWEDVKVTYNGQEISLPIHNANRIRSEYLEEGEVPAAAAGLWQLPMNADQSFQHVFGYELYQGGKPENPWDPIPYKARPVEPEVYNNDNFMPSSTTSQLPAAGDIGTTTLVYVAPLRIVVVLTLVCGKQSGDFTPPGGVVEAGRIYPLLSLMANQSFKFDKALARIKLMRSSTTPHTEMDGEKMTSIIHSGLYADNNSPEMLTHVLGHGPDGPNIWPEFFSHYDTFPSAGRYVMADPALAARVIPDAVKTVTLETKSPYTAAIRHEKTLSFSKAARQGEYDSIHLAPQMIAPDVVRKSNPKAADLDSIAMAPFCAHDCFHMHTRWGTQIGAGKVSKNKEWCGWQGWTPYAEPGAPMVPPNQKVTMELKPGSDGRFMAGFVYEAEIQNPAQGQWHIVFHHGAAYALAVDTLADVARFGQYSALSLGVFGTSGWSEILNGESQTSGYPWSMFYWHKRFAVGHEKDASGIYHMVSAERMMIDLAKARK